MVRNHGGRLARLGNQMRMGRLRALSPLCFRYFGRGICLDEFKLIIAIYNWYFKYKYRKNKASSGILPSQKSHFVNSA